MMTETRKTYDEMTDTERQKCADALWTRERPRCQSALVDALLGLGNMDGFDVGDMENLYPDPSDWDIAECRGWLDGYDEENYPDGFDANAESDLPDDYGGIDIDAWREAVIDHADPAEVYEWWEVGSWLCDRLRDAGEVVLDNDYGHWWGRCCTGQAVKLDCVIQRLGAEYAACAIDG